MSTTAAQRPTSSKAVLLSYVANTGDIT